MVRIIHMRNIDKQGLTKWLIGVDESHNGSMVSANLATLNLLS